MMRSGAISVFIGILPAMKMTDPYSPSARPKASAKPVSTAGIKIGKMTRRHVCQRVAPRLAAASSSSTSRFWSTGWTVRTTKGSPMKVSAIMMPSGENAALIPSGSRYCPIQPSFEYTAVSAMPATAVGRANGRSTRASANRRPGNS